MGGQLCIVDRVRSPAVELGAALDIGYGERDMMDAGCIYLLVHPFLLGRYSKGLSRSFRTFLGADRAQKLQTLSPNVSYQMVITTFS